MYLPSPYGITVSLALLVGYIWAYRRAIHRGISSEHILNMALVSAPIILIGARLHHTITDWHYYAHDPIQALYLWNGGLGFWGAFFAGIAVVVLYCRIKNIPTASVLDAVALPVLFVIAVGRWGNVLNSELVPFAYIDSIANLFLLIGFIVLEHKKQIKEGNLFLYVLLSYATTRVFLETLRSEWRILNIFTINQMVCILVIVCVGVLLVRRDN